uniref:Intracellular protein transport protein USO1-like n=1 Tax=Phallusia mammillata TaxID=59560 RepID=A0A6F9D982_9ASCI|nr:intracellular protein transport protein USO1-like [Phallusia mammillata]
MAHPPSFSADNEVFTSDDIQGRLVDDSGAFEIVPSPQELHKKYQQFLRANGSRNNSAEWQDDVIFTTDEACDLSDATCSSNGSDFSFHDGDMAELIQKNKSYRQKNNELRSKNDQLLRNLETYEDELEKQKLEIIELEKEIKSCHEINRERENLHQEMEGMQLEMKESDEERKMLEEELKRKKNDEEDTLVVLNSLRDQVDTLSNEVRCLNEINQINRDETAELKGNCEKMQAEIELKSYYIDQKEEVIKGMKLQLEEYVVLHKNLQEEKEKLMNELREGQLEVSSYQSYFKFPDEITSAKSPRSGDTICNLKSELAAADQDVNESFNGGNLDFQFPNSPPNEVFHNYFMNRSGFNTSINNSTLGTPVVDQKQRLFVKKDENSTQTEQISTTDVVSQTTEPPIQQYEVETLLNVQEHCTELQEQLKWKEEEIESLNEYLDLEKSQKRYFTTQLEASRTKYGQVQIDLDKKSEETLQLTDIISKLCISKLHFWYQENFDPDVPEIETSYLINTGEQTSDSKATLIDALALESTSLSSKNKHISCLPLKSKWEDLRRLYRKMAVCMESDKLSAEARIFVLQKCQNLILDLIVDKFDKLASYLKEPNITVMPPKCDPGPTQSSFDHLRVLQSLVARLLSLSRNISNVKAEIPYFTAFRVFTHHTAELKQKIRDLKSTLASQPKQIIQKTYDEPFELNELGLDASVYEDPSVDEVSVDLLHCVVLPDIKTQWFKKILTHDSVFDAACIFFSVCRGFQKVVKSNRISSLVLFFMICVYLSISPMDYKVEPIF